MRSVFQRKNSAENSLSFFSPRKTSAWRTQINPASLGFDHSLANACRHSETTSYDLRSSLLFCGFYSADCSSLFLSGIWWVSFTPQPWPAACTICSKIRYNAPDLPRVVMVTSRYLSPGNAAGICFGKSDKKNDQDIGDKWEKLESDHGLEVENGERSEKMKCYMMLC